MFHQHNYVIIQDVKLVIQIPCFNEEKTLPSVLKELPKKISGVDVIEVQIVDDGSTDNTVQVAKKHKVDRVIKHIGNKGLGKAFTTGVESALENQADILVNTDGDNQYPGKYIEKLVQPIINQEADIVIGDRQTAKIEHFSPLKKRLQAIGSRVVRLLSGTDVPDAVSGFRAYSRNALLELNTVTKFSYCIDTIVQAGKKDLKIVSVPITTNSPTRKSRLFNNLWQHVKNSTTNLLRIFAVYEPFKTFLMIGLVLLIPSLLIIGRFIYFFFSSEGSGHIQSLILGGALFAGAIQMFALAILADLVSINRRLIERGLKNHKKLV